MDKYSVVIHDGGRKIAAIKALRSATARDGQPTNLGLKEAKDIVESGGGDHFTVIMTKDQCFKFLMVTVQDNASYLSDAHVRILDVTQVTFKENDITNI